MTNHRPAARPLIGLVMIFPLLSFWLGGCDYARMTEDEAVNTFQTAMPAMDERTIPAAGGPRSLRGISPQELANPRPVTKESVTQGRVAYGYFCVHCHGPKADGRGTVGQSFAPLPADLKSPAIQSQSDGLLFLKISRGYKRHPPLAYTVSGVDRWAIICYLRSLGQGLEEQ